MKRKRMLFGLVVVALLAVGVMATTAQSGGPGGEFTGIDTPSGKHVETWVDGVESTVHDFKTPNSETSCESVTFSVQVPTGTTKSLTAAPTYKKCHVTVTGIPGTFPVTVHTNGCDFAFAQPVTNEEDIYSGGAALKCPGTNVVEIEVYEKGNTESHQGSRLCLTTVFPSESLMSNLEYENETGSVPTDIAVKTGISGLPYQQHGPFCPEGNAKKENGQYAGTSTLAGTDAAEEPIDFELSPE